ncbi:MAG: enoyl-CoA hydratase/isomerase family protein [Elusimicrobiota bacterium]
MIDIENNDGVRSIWLNSPPSNSLTPELLDALRGAVRAAGAERSVRCLLLGSRLPKYFSSGIDIDAIFAPPPARRIEIFMNVLETHRELAELPKPTIAALPGYAMLAGWIMAMACDFRIMAEKTGRVALSEIRFGLTPTEFMLRRLREMGAGMNAAKQLVLRGKTLKAQEALDGGLVDQLVPAAELAECALQEAKKLAKLPPETYASIKRDLAASAGVREGLWERSMAEFRRVYESPEAQAGLTAMREKRTPVYP